VPKTTLFSLQLDPWLIFAAKAFRQCQVEADTIVLGAKGTLLDADSQDCYKWLEQNESFQVNELEASSLEQLSGDNCFVVVRGSQNLAGRILIRNIISKHNRSVALLRFGKSSLRWQIKQLLKEIKDPFFSQFTELWSEDNDINLINSLLNKRHRFYGALPHQRCSIIQHEWEKIDRGLVSSDKTFLFSWAGSSAPSRDVIAQWIEHRLNPSATQIDLGPSLGKHNVSWFYDRPGSCRERPYSNYISNLQKAWFSLCLPGYTGTTNRVLESVLCGSIPVIPRELVKYHRIDFVHGYNCVLVDYHDWPAAIRHIARMPRDQKLFLQMNVQNLAKTRASLQSISSRLVAEILGF